MTRDADRGWIAPLLYSFAVSLSAGLASFVLLLVIVQLGFDGEEAMLLGVTWIFMLPWILIAGFLGRVSFRWYRGQQTWSGAAAVFLATVVAAVAVGVGIGYGFAWFNS